MRRTAQSNPSNRTRTPETINQGKIMMPDFFAELGKAELRELNSPGDVVSRRERFRGAADQALTRHLARPMAQDAAIQPRRTARDQEFGENTAPRGGNPAGNPHIGNGLTAEQALASVGQMLQGMDPDQAEQFFSQLLDLAQEAPGHSSTGEDEAPDNGPPNALPGIRKNNLNALDRRLAADSAIIRRRRIALDSANSAGFQERWGSAVSHVQVSGSGWRMPGR